MTIGPLLGMTVFKVDPGTVVGQDSEGKDMIVTEINAVTNGNRMWVTERQYAAIKARVTP